MQLPRTVRFRRTRRGLCGLLLSLVAAAFAPAQVLYWDRNGSTAGSGNTGGNWSNGAKSWSSSSAGTASTSGWSSGRDAVFSAGTDGTGSYTATIPNNTMSVSSVTVTEGTVTIGGAGTLNFSDSTPDFSVASGLLTTVSAVVSGSNGLNKIDDGTLVLSGANTYTGTTTINAGTIRVSSDGNLGNGGALVLTGGNIGGGTLTTTSTFTLNASRAFTIDGDGGSINVAVGTLTYDGTLAGSGTLDKDGAGTFVTGGSSTNSHSGDININAGVFEVAKTGYVGGINNGSAVTIADGATLRLNGGAGYTQETIGSLAGAGTVTNVGAAAVNLVISSSASTTFSGIITDTTNDLNLIKNTGTGTFTLTGANSYDGPTTISTGVINIQNDTALGTTVGGTTVASGAALELQGGIAVGAEALTLSGSGVGANGALRSVSGTNTYGGAITLAAASEIQTDAGQLTLTNTIGGSNQNLTLDGAGDTIISGVIGTGSGTLTKTGSGTVSLSGANTYTGNTTVSAGTLAIQNSAQSANYSIASGAVLELNVASGSRENGASATYTGTGILRKTGPGNIYWGSASVGTFALGSGSLIDVQAGTFTAGSFANEVWTNNLSDLTVAAGAAFNGVEANVRVNAINGAGLIRSGWSPSQGYQNFTFGVDNGSGTFSGTLDNYSPYTGNFVKEGTGTQVLSGANTFTGTMTVSAGVLNIQNSAALGTTAGGTTVASGAALELQGGIAVGAEALTLSGSGVGANGALRSVSGTNTYGGTITLAAASEIQTDAGQLTLTNTIGGTNQNLTLDGVGDTIISGAIGTGSGTLTKAGSGTATLSGTAANTFTGATSVGGGILALNKTAGTNAIAGNVTITPGGTLRLDANNQIADTASVSFGGSGAATFNVNGRTETIAGLSGANISAAVTLGSGGALTVGAGNASSSYSGAISGTGNLTKTGTGTLTLAGANSFTGAAAVNGGTLLAGANNILTAANSLTVATGASLNLASYSAAVATIAGTGTIQIGTGGALAVGSTGSNSSFGGALTGTGMLQKVGAGDLTFTSNVNFAGELRLSAGEVTLAGVNFTVGTLRITGNTVLDFGNSAASVLNVTNLIIDPGAALTIVNWVDSQDFFYVNGTFVQSGGPAAAFNTQGAAPQNQITFTGWNSNITGWQSWDHQVRPTPEPATYGAILMSGVLAFVFWRRRKRAAPEAALA